MANINHTHIRSYSCYRILVMIGEYNTANMKTMKDTTKIMVWVLTLSLFIRTINMSRGTICFHIIRINHMRSIKFPMVSVNAHVNHRQSYVCISFCYFPS